MYIYIYIYVFEQAHLFGLSRLLTTPDDITTIEVPKKGHGFMAVSHFARAPKRAGKRAGAHQGRGPFKYAHAHISVCECHFCGRGPAGLFARGVRFNAFSHQPTRQAQLKACTDNNLLGF